MSEKECHVKSRHVALQVFATYCEPGLSDYWCLSPPACDGWGVGCGGAVPSVGAKNTQLIHLQHIQQTQQVQLLQTVLGWLDHLVDY